MRSRMVTGTRAGLAALCVAAVLIAGCGQRSAEQQPAERVVPVDVGTVEKASVSPSLEFSASIVPSREASVGAMMSAQVLRMHVEPGDAVSKGDLMVEMAGEQLTQAQAAFVSAQKDWERMKQLLESGAVTQQAFDRADAGYQAAKAAYELVRESTMIRAPFSGTVTATYLEEGEVFVLMPSGASTPAIVEVVSMDTVKVEIGVPESELPEVRKGLKATLEVPAYPGRKFVGAVELVEPAISTSTRTARAEIVIPNRDKALRPGMYAHLSLELSPRDALLVPHDGVVQQEGTGRHYSMLYEDGHARRADVVLGRPFGAFDEVLSGLQEGQKVITSGRYRLPDGARVEVKSEGEAR
ncbi:MAG: efflux RND transporter periplasmic adaptor subunit [Candidatus Eisenbacteria bacterium]|nr:efflux RND transporter periplasmic adaptor subunit [Candidatus Eisenbacteria bacterium]